MADKVKVTAVSALAEGFCPLEIRVGQVPEVDHIGMAKHAPQLHQAALLEYVPVKASCGMNRVLSIIFSLCVVVHLLAVLHVLWGYKDQLHIVHLAIIDMLNSTGMRVGELVSLDITDIDFEERECVVLGKGDKERIVYFDARTKLHLKKYLNTRTDKKPGTVRLDPESS